MKRAAWSALVAACGGAPATLEHKVPAAPIAIELPAAYAGLFVAGRTWTFPAESDYGTYDIATGHTHDTTHGTVVCAITEARAIRGGRVAELDCNPTDVTLPQSPSGTYVGTAKGLWRVDGSFADDITVLDPAEMLLAATPVEYRREHQDAQRSDFGSSMVVIEHRGGWCISRETRGGDEGGWTLCLRAVDGVFGGGGFFGGAATRDTYFGEAPRD